MSKVLLLGNGLNNVTNNYKWGNLIDDLISYLGLRNIATKQKPFPLLYEEIYLSNLKNKKISEYDIKSYIAQKIGGLLPNKVHKSIESLSISNVLTTNYDYVIEQALGYNSQDLSDNGAVKQRRYSLFRHTKVGGKRVWHIHGEINKPNTILLGFEQYSGQLQQMRNYVVSGTGNAYKKRFAPLKDRLKKGDIEIVSWLDLFFTQDIHIVGLSLEFSENDLWWLINYRARRRLEGKGLGENTITYYYSSTEERGKQSKLDMLKANEICIHPIDRGYDLIYYQCAFDHLQGILR